MSSDNPELKPDSCEACRLCVPATACHLKLPLPLPSLQQPWLPSYLHDLCLAGVLFWLLPTALSHEAQSLFPGFFSEVTHPSYFPAFPCSHSHPYPPPTLPPLNYQDPGYYHCVNLSLLPQKCKLLGEELHHSCLLLCLLRKVTCSYPPTPP